MTGEHSAESARGDTGGESVLLRDLVVGEAGGLQLAVASLKSGAAGSSTGDGGL